jgi:hypothetical protein
VFELQQEYFALKELYDLAFACMEIGNDLSPFMELFKLLKRNKMLQGIKLKENHQEENSILTGEHLLKMKSNDNATETVGFTTMTSKQIV